MRAVGLCLLLLPACIDYNVKGSGSEPSGEGDDTLGETAIDTSGVVDEACPAWEFETENVGLTDECSTHTGSFTPIVEWSLGEGLLSTATVAVGDLNADGIPEVVANIAPLFGDSGGLFATGSLVVASGDGSGILWQDDEADIAFASGPSIGDLDGDGWPEIVIVREYASSLLAVGDYTLVAYDGTGSQVWESEHFVGDDFDYASTINLVDMDHDGSPEINAGRVILHADGTTRGVGIYGRGCMGQVVLGDMTIDEGTVSAVADLNLDGIDEVIVGNAMYSPDGDAIWHELGTDDALIAVANLDDDPEGEFVATTGATVRAVDTDGTVMWGPVTVPTANILSPPAIDDLDGDGSPEILVAGGNHLWAMHADGSLLWNARVTDMSGASGASIFDFEGDGQPEVVYIDEVEMAAYDGATGALKFYSSDHVSNTLYDYPVIADVDGDDQAEIVVANYGSDAAIFIYGDLDESWAPARKVWNQHGYSITNINDDLSIPTTATPNFTTYNSYHSALDDVANSGLADDLEGEILDVCDLDCGRGVLRVAGRLRNKADEALPAGVWVALYAVVDGENVLADVAQTLAETPAQTSGEVLDFEVDATLAASADRLWLNADDDGAGVGSIEECSEGNNGFVWEGGLCP